ncbi:MAG: DUF4430 domain-containing protein, partial [bacterium]|nr:DUF4430 domain-containing protein [bacterium]
MTKFPKILLAALVLTFLAAGCNTVQPNQNLTPTNQNQTQTIKVYQSVEGSNFNSLDPYQSPSGETAMQLLKSVHQVKTKDFGPGLGEFAESIDGIIPAKDQFWAFYINGKSSDVGASSYKLSDGDK